MNTNRNIEPPAGISPADIYFVVFRHKWKIIILTLLGLAAAAFFYFTRPPLYQSEAKLYIRYVSDNHAMNLPGKGSQETSTLDLGRSVLDSEMEILTSYDLAAEVATNLGPEKILAKMGGGSDPTAAAIDVKRNLKVEAMNDSSVLYLTFHHADPSLVRPVLSEIIADYLDKHAQVHNAIGMSDDTLQEDTAQLHLQLAQTEDELRMAKTNAGIISVADSDQSYADEMAGIRRKLFQAEQDLAEHKTSLRQLTGTPVKGDATNLTAKVSDDDLTRYKFICSRLAYLERRQNDYLRLGYTGQNKMIQETREQMLAATKTKTELEQQFPALTDLDVSVDTSSSSPSTAEAANSDQVISLPARIKVLQEQMAQIKGEAAKLDEAEAKIADLERKRKIQEDNYQHFATTLEQSRFDEALGPGHVSNIQVIQQPSPPGKDFSKFYEIMGMLAFGGLLAGLAWAFLIEFYLDRSIKRPMDVSAK